MCVGVLCVTYVLYMFVVRALALQAVVVQVCWC